jgi:hypothetical protein
MERVTDMKKLLWAIMALAFICGTMAGVGQGLAAAAL